MKTPRFPALEAFEAEARMRGYDQVLTREWAPETLVATHTHPFDAWAQVSRGEMWLTVDGQTQHLLRGAQFMLDAHQPHAERYGDDGAAYWVARRHAGLTRTARARRAVNSGARVAQRGMRRRAAKPIASRPMPISA